jgi:hypothetical protein
VDAEMSWEAVTAICAVIVIVGSLLGMFIRQAIDSAVARMELHLLETLDRRYVQRVEWEQWMRLRDERNDIN